MRFAFRADRAALPRRTFTAHSASFPNLSAFNRSLPMRLLLSAILAGGSLVFAIAAVAQSTPSTPAASVNPAPAEPVASGKRFACQSASQSFKGQEQKDQMQLCMAQARLDCLKQAIDQKIVGPPRRDFVKNCVQDLPE